MAKSCQYGGTTVPIWWHICATAVAKDCQYGGKELAVLSVQEHLCPQQIIKVSGIPFILQSSVGGE